MGWLDEHEKKFDEERKAKREAARREKEQRDSHSAWADSAAKNLYDKVKEVHGKKTGRGKISVKLKENVVEINVGDEKFANIGFTVQERMEGTYDGQGWGTGQYDLEAHAWYNDKGGLYGNGSREYFYEDELAKKISALLRSK